MVIIENNNFTEEAKQSVAKINCFLACLFEQKNLVIIAFIISAHNYCKEANDSYNWIDFTFISNVSNVTT